MVILICKFVLAFKIDFWLNFIGQFFWSYNPRSNQLLFSADILGIVSGISKILSNKSELHVHLRLDYRFRLMFRVFHNVGETKALKGVRSVNPK